MEEFLEISNRLSWHEAALGACFLLGLDDEVIRCDLPVSDFPLIELINLILFLNGSVEEIPRPRHPTPAGTRRISPVHPTPRTSAYLSNGSYRLPNPKDPPCLQSSSILLSPEPGTRASRAPPRVRASRAPSCACSKTAPSCACSKTAPSCACSKTAPSCACSKTAPSCDRSSSACSVQWPLLASSFLFLRWSRQALRRSRWSCPAPHCQSAPGSLRC